jgi:hypothetical protein
MIDHSSSSTSQIVGNTLTRRFLLAIRGSLVGSNEALWPEIVF